MSAKPKKEKETKDEEIPLSGEMVNINDSALPGHEIEIPVELRDEILERYAEVEQKNALTASITTRDKKITGLMHLYKKELPKKPGTGETYCVISGIEAILEKEEKEKLHTRKVKEEK